MTPDDSDPLHALPSSMDGEFGDFEIRLFSEYLSSQTSFKFLGELSNPSTPRGIPH